MDDRKAVALALIASFTILAADDVLVRDRAPQPRQVVAMSAVFLFLGFLVEIAPKPAKYFSILLALGTFYKVGPTVWTKAQASLSGKKTAKKTPVRTVTHVHAVGP